MGWDDVGHTGQGVPVLSLSLLFFFFPIVLSLLGSNTFLYSKPAYDTLPGLGAFVGTQWNSCPGTRRRPGHGRASDHKLEVHGCGQSETSCKEVLEY